MSISKTSKKTLLFKICLTAIFAAIYVLLDMLSLKFGNYLQISINALPIIIVAVFFGPGYAMCTGFIGEFLCQILSYGFMFPATFWWTLPAVLRGFSTGIIFIAFKRSDKILPLSINIICSSILVSALNTFILIFESKILGYYAITVSTAFFVTRLTSSLATAIVMIIIIYPILKALKKTKFLRSKTNE